jgi:hypothetical protein
MDRRKKLVNHSEEVTERILESVARYYGARVFSKPRLADVVDLSSSGLTDPLFNYGLKAHLDFVVTDEEAKALFAVEFDGPYHLSDRSARIRDRKKNSICEQLGLPLARVQDEHVFEEIRGQRYLEWLTDIFFSAKDIREARRDGIVPPMTVIDPMGFLTHSRLEGSRPLFLSGRDRTELIELAKDGLISPPTPAILRGTGNDGASKCLAITVSEDGKALIGKGSLYLRGFGISASEAAEEIALVNLAANVRDYQTDEESYILPCELRNLLVQFIKLCEEKSLSGGITADLGFEFSHRMMNGTAIWRVGSIRGQEEFVHREDSKW